MFVRLALLLLIILSLAGCAGNSITKPITSCTDLSEANTTVLTLEAPNWQVTHKLQRWERDTLSSGGITYEVKLTATQECPDGISFEYVIGNQAGQKFIKWDQTTALTEDIKIRVSKDSASLY